MPLNLTKKTVEATYLESDGTTPAAGSVSFRLSTPQLDQAGNVIVVPRTIKVLLDENGAISVELVATNDPEVQPTGATYLITESIIGTGPR